MNGFYQVSPSFYLVLLRFALMLASFLVLWTGLRGRRKDLKVFSAGGSSQGME